MDVISYALSKKIAAHVVSGIQSMSVNGQTLTINTKDSGVLTMTFPTPKDGVSVTDIDVNANNQIVFTMSDGSEFISGKIPTVKGEPGFSPTITENADNTDKIYKLDITTADKTFTTPNLKGADGQGGGGGDSSVTLTQEEYEALTEEEKLNGLYYIYDTKRIYKNSVQYGASEPIPLTMAEYETLKEAGAIDEQQEYLIEADDKGILISAEDIGYSNTKSGIQATTVQGAIDKIAESGGSGEKNVQSDWNETDDTADGFIKNKPTIPEAYDDTALSNRVKTIEDDYAKSNDIPSLSGYATEAWVNEQGFLTEHQDISNLVEKEDGKTLISTEDISQIAQNKTDIETLNGAGEGSIEKKIADKLSEQTYLTKEIATADEVAAYITDPTTAKFNVIYLVKDENATGADKYFEYQRIGNEESSLFQMTGDTSTDLSDYAKSADIPTTLPADGGNSDTVNNHTVETDVPIDAVFTDTIYDDTEVKGSIDELNSNLETLEYGKVAGGKQLHDGKIYYFYQNVASPSVCAAYDNADSIIFETADLPDIITVNADNSNRNVVCYYDTFPAAGVSSVTNITEVTSGMPKNITVDKTHKYILIQLSYGQHVSNVMVNEGNISVPYEPYIPSVKMLAEEVNQQNEGLAYNASKNMLTVNVGTISGVTITSKDKSTALLNGTSTANVSVFTTADVIPSGLYHLKLSNKVGSMFVWDTIHSKTIVDVDSTECNFTLTESSKLLVGFSVGNGHSFTNFEASGQLEKGTVATDFVPYNGKSNLELTNDVVSLKNDLDTLEFGEVAGGKNIAKFFNGVYDTNSKQFIHIGTSDYCSTNFIPCENKNSISVKTDNYSSQILIGIFDANKNFIRWEKNENPGNLPFTANITDAHYTMCVIRSVGGEVVQPSYFGNIMLNFGAPLPYEPYIPSVKMLAEENAQQNTESMDLKMLGWTVPSECPIQNEVSGNQFIQKVGRVDLGTLSYSELGSFGYYVKIESAKTPTNNSSVANIYLNGFTTVKRTDLDGSSNSIAMTDYKEFCINNAKSAIPSGYLYYELETPITMTIDGNEVTERINDSLSVIGKCKNLLNPTLQTTTQNGITCTDNGDGTYTLNGTASGLTTFILCDMKLDSSLSYKLTGCPLGGDWDNGYSMYVEKQYWGIDVGKGYEITLTDASNICGVYIRIIKDTVCNNLVFKPMITTDLSATYDDFVPYTGDGETLTADVAELKNDLSELRNIKKTFANENTTYTYTASEMHLENDHIYDVFLKGNYPTAGCGCCRVFVKNNQYVLLNIAAEYIEFSMDSSNGTLTITNKYNGTQGTQLIVKKIV